MTRHEIFAVPQRAKLTVADFLALSERGAFDDYARTELIEGEIWVVNAIHSRHARVHAQLTVELGVALKASGASLVLYSNPSTELSNISLPEPDIVVADPADEKMVAGPTVRLAVEISDSSLDMDLTRKLRLYARHGVPEYWVADVEGGVIHQLWSPQGEDYTQGREVSFGERIALETIEALEIDTDALK
jgi:Uma2 family endonuclease